MLARHYVREDAAGLDRLLGDNRDGDVRLDRDKIIVCGPIGEPFACLVWRPYAFLHEFHCGKGMAPRIAANVLTNFALGDVLNGLYPIGDAIFSVVPGNAPMSSFVRGIYGIVDHKGEDIYRLPLRLR
jgi:hypothetical protein